MRRPLWFALGLASGAVVWGGLGWALETLDQVPPAPVLGALMVGCGLVLGRLSRR